MFATAESLGKSSSPLLDIVPLYFPLMLRVFVFFFALQMTSNHDQRFKISNPVLLFLRTVDSGCRPVSALRGPKNERLETESGFEKP